MPNSLTAAALPSSRATPAAPVRHRSVCAVVVTFNRKELLRECLRAIGAQDRPADKILVVDNASTDGTADLMRHEFPDVELLVLPENAGGAGGFHEGLRVGRERGFAWLWIMDDDAAPEPDCLRELLDTRAAHVAVPIQRDRTGRLYGASVWRGRPVDVSSQLGSQPREIDLFAFVGPLISSEVVDTVGLPDKDYFIYFDDWQYSLRIRRAGLRVLAVPTAIVRHDFGITVQPSRLGGLIGVRTRQPAWKTYYDTRNYLHAILRAAPSVRSLAWYAGLQLRRAVGDLVYEPDRWHRLGLRGLGITDGVLGRMGRRVR